jgi:hypothetical protein
VILRVMDDFDKPISSSIVHKIAKTSYCDVHAVGQQWKRLLATVARQTPRDMFSIWSDPSLLRNNGKAAFSTRSVPRQQLEGCVFFVVCSRAI